MSEDRSIAAVLGLAGVGGPGQPQVLVRRSVPAGCRAPAARSRCRAGCASCARPARHVDAVDRDPARRSSAPGPIRCAAGSSCPCRCGRRCRPPRRPRAGSRNAVQHRHVAVAGAQAGDLEDDVARRRGASAFVRVSAPAHLARFPCRLRGRADRRAPCRHGPSSRIAPWWNTVTLPRACGRNACRDRRRSARVPVDLADDADERSRLLAGDAGRRLVEQHQPGLAAPAPLPISTSWRCPCASSPTGRRAMRLRGSSAPISSATATCACSRVPTRRADSHRFSSTVSPLITDGTCVLMPTPRRTIS